MQEPVLASALAAMAGVCWQPPSRHVTLHLPRLEELNTDCSVLQGLLPHVVSLIQHGGSSPPSCSRQQSASWLPCPHVRPGLHCGCAPPSVRHSCAPQDAAGSVKLSCCMACCEGRLLRLILWAWPSCCQHASYSKFTMQPCPNMRPRRRCTAQCTPTAGPKSCC